MPGHFGVSVPTQSLPIIGYLRLEEGGRGAGIFRVGFTGMEDWGILDQMVGPRDTWSERRDSERI